MAFELWPNRLDVDTNWVGEIARMKIKLVIPAMASALFVCCMVCHGESARLKPHPRHLTGFYVTVSLGGAVGGLFVGLVAPNLFRAYYEFPIGLALCALVVAVVLARALATRPMALRLAGSAAVLLGGRDPIPLDRPAGCLSAYLHPVLRSAPAVSAARIPAAAGNRVRLRWRRRPSRAGRSC
jgi:hypothetical protein